MTREPAPDGPTDGGWIAAGASVIGSAHRREGRPNQDAFAHRTIGAGVVAAVADGHGATQHPRSGAGARLAADLLVDRFGALGAEVGRSAVRAVADAFVRDWRAAVDADLATRPLDASERDGMGRGDGSPAFARRAYGTTVLGLHAGGERVSAIAIGDGELGYVDAAATHHALCAAERTIGVETASLAADDPARVLRLECVPADGVVAVWACTDGFSEAQRDPGWRTLVAGQLRALRGDRDAIEQDLAGWLVPSADTGGDDTTMVLVLRRPGAGAIGRSARS